MLDPELLRLIPGHLARSLSAIPVATKGDWEHLILVCKKQPTAAQQHGLRSLMPTRTFTFVGREDFPEIYDNLDNLIDEHYGRIDEESQVFSLPAVTEPVKE